MQITAVNCKSSFLKPEECFNIFAITLPPLTVTLCCVDTGGVYELLLLTLLLYLDKVH